MSGLTDLVCIAFLDSLKGRQMGAELSADQAHMISCNQALYFAHKVC